MDTAPGVSPRERALAVAPGISARAAAHDRDATFPFGDFADLHAVQLLALTVPRDHGGEGAGLADAASVLEVMGAANASTALVLAMQYQQHANLARNPDTPRSATRTVFESAVRDGALINALRVEPDLGTPARGGLPATIARRTADGWALSGHKQYVTGAPALRWYTVWARSDHDEPIVGSFLVDAAGHETGRSRGGPEGSFRGLPGGPEGGPRRSPGISIVETWDHLGMRATGSHDVIFDKVALPADAAVAVGPPPGGGANAADPRVMGWNGICISAVYHGVAVAARDWLVQYLHERVPANLGAPLASLPRFQTAVGEIETLLGASSMLMRSTAAAIDSGDRAACAAANTVKHHVTNNAIRAVDIALALVGNPGLSRKHALERHYRDVLCSRIHTPQDDSILLGAGRAVLKI